MKDLLHKHHGAYGISSTKLAQILHRTAEQTECAINILFFNRIQKSGFTSCADFFVSENGHFWVSHKGCMELQKEFFSKEAEVWNELNETFRTAEEKNLLKFCHTLLEENVRYNDRRNYRLPEKAFIISGSQYIHSDGIIIRLNEQHNLDMEQNVSEEETAYISDVFEQCRKLCREEVFFQMNVSEMVYEAIEDYHSKEKGICRMSQYSFGDNQTELPMELIGNAAACMPSMTFYRTYESGKYFFDTEDNLFQFSKNVLYGKDCYGNECIVAFTLPNEKRCQYREYFNILPDRAWFYPEIREVSLAEHESFAAYLSPKAFLHLSYQDMEHFISRYMEKFGEKYSIIAKLKPQVYVDFGEDTNFEMLKRVTNHDSGILFAVSNCSDDKQVFIDSFEVSGDKFLPISTMSRTGSWNNQHHQNM